MSMSMSICGAQGTNTPYELRSCSDFRAQTGTFDDSLECYSLVVLWQSNAITPVMMISLPVYASAWRSLYDLHLLPWPFKHVINTILLSFFLLALDFFVTLVFVLEPSLDPSLFQPILNFFPPLLLPPHKCGTRMDTEAIDPGLVPPLRLLRHQRRVHLEEYIMEARAEVCAVYRIMP